MQDPEYRKALRDVTQKSKDAADAEETAEQEDTVNESWDAKAAGSMSHTTPEKMQVSLLLLVAELSTRGQRMLVCSMSECMFAYRAPLSIGAIDLLQLLACSNVQLSSLGLPGIACF